MMIFKKAIEDQQSQSFDSSSESSSEAEVVPDDEDDDVQFITASVNTDRRRMQKVLPPGMRFVFSSPVLQSLDQSRHKRYKKMTRN